LNKFPCPSFIRSLVKRLSTFALSPSTLNHFGPAVLLDTTGGFGSSGGQREQQQWKIKAAVDSLSSSRQQKSWQQPQQQSVIVYKRPLA
jgi:hypothetical protein